MTLEEIRDKKLGAVINTKTKKEAMLLVKALGVDESRFYGETDFIDVWDAFKENTCYRVVDGKVDMSDCVKYYQSINEKIYEFSDLFATGELISHIVGISYEDYINKLTACLSAFPNDGISAKNGGKNSMKFTFYFNVNEGTRVDKSCNGTTPTITTSVVLDKFGDSDRRKCYSLKGEATCDKVDYDMRQGVLEALANAVFDGSFEKAYDKAVKTNAFCERQDRTCTYCGKLFDTVAEKEVHEAWHVERKKARRERYLLRKRAKEIAFEEAAQKMAKEMMGEQK